MNILSVSPSIEDKYKRIKARVSVGRTQNINSKKLTPPNFPNDGNPVRSDEWNEADEHNFEIQNHPLLNDVILRKVLDHVRRKDLLVCRGVCKKWNAATIPYTRLAFEITIYENKTLCSYGVPGLEYYTASELNAEQNIRKVQNFVELISSNTLGIPFGKFKLGAFPTTYGVGQKFLGLCGDTMLEISFLDDIYKVEDVCEILKSTPKLESFHVPTKISSQLRNNVKLFPEGIQRLNHLKKITIEAGPNNICPIYLEEILSVAKNTPVLHLTLNDGISDNPKGNYKSLEVLRLIDKLGLISSIKTLCLTRMRTEHVNILISQPNTFNLKSLIYYTSEGGVDPLKLITFFKNTLHSFGTISMPTNIFLGMEKMPHLTKMCLGFDVILNSRCVNLEKIFPALERLDLFGRARVLHEDFFPESEPCLTLKSLQLHNLHLTLNGFKHIQIIFPNLTKLHLSVSLNELENVRYSWLHMTNLEVLTIEGDFLTPVDSVFTGISIQGIQEITRTCVMKELEGMTMDIRRETIRNMKNQYSQPPSIANLTKLRSVSLNVSGRQGTHYERHLTDLTLYLGLYGMENLKHVVIENCGFTETGCKILRDEMGLESWSFQREEYERIPLYTLKGSVRLASNVQAIVHKDII